MSYYDILLAKQLSGGGGGGDITVESLSVTANGTYSAPSGKAYTPVSVNVPSASGSTNISSNGTYDVAQYASAVVAVPNSYTASDEGKVVSSGALVAQTSETYTANGTYDTTLKNSVTVNVSGGGPVIVGALRPDAERCYHDVDDKLVAQDLGITIPAYSTTQATLIASNYSYATVTLDPDNYWYFYAGRLLSYPVYSTNTPVKGRFEYYAEESVVELVETDNSKFKSLAVDVASSTAKKYETAPKCIATYLYWSSATALKSDNSTSTLGGVYYDTQTPTYNATTKVLSIPLPALKIKGNTTAFTSDAWSTMTDIRIQHVFDVYRVPKTNATVDGFNITSNMMHIAKCIANGGTLT